MKVFNLSDVPTPKLAQLKLVDHTFLVGTILLDAGQSADISDAQVEHLRKGLQSLVAAGALAIGAQPPAAYVLAKEKAREEARKKVPAVVATTDAGAPRPSRRGDTLPVKGQG